MKFMESRMNTASVVFDRVRFPGEIVSRPLARLSLPRFALKDSDPLWADARVESYAAATRPYAPSGASNQGI
jgi:hypothetical protein